MDEPYILLTPENGLANRIRSIASCLVLANHLKYKLYVNWTISTGFDHTKFTDLFNKFDKVELISSCDYESLSNKSFNLSEVYDGLCDTCSSQFNKDVYTHKLFKKEFKYIKLRCSNYIPWAIPSKIISENIPNFKNTYTDILANIIPSNYVLFKSLKVIDSFEKQKVIGIHIRAGDATSSKNMHNGMYSNKVQQTIFDFVKNNSFKFFLCTDEKRIHDLYYDNFKDRMFCYKKSFVKSEYGKEKQGQVDAMIELYILSKTNNVLLTSPSSFAKLSVDLSTNGRYLVNKSIFNSSENIQKLNQILNQ